MRAKRSKAVTDGNAPSVDLTPMLDVVFILLIFFIITASFVKERTLNTNLLEKNNADNASSQVSLTLVNITEDNEIIIDNRRVSSESVRSILASKQAESAGQASLLIRAHERSNANTYVLILDAAKSAGVGSVMMEAVHEV